MGYITTNLHIAVSLIVVNFFQIFAITTRLNRDYSPGGHAINLGTLSIPDWELGLREAISRALTSENSVRVKNLQEYIQQAPLLGRQNYASPFGDIAIVARGQLYSAPGGFELLQDLYQNDCDGCHNKPPKCGRVPCENWKPYDHERLLALWTVKRIRHRDDKFGYIYEFEYKISPMSMVTNERFVTRNGNFDYSVSGRLYVARVDPEQNLNSLNRDPNPTYDYEPYEEPNWNPEPAPHYLPPPLPTPDEFYDSDPRKPGYPGGLYDPPLQPQHTTEKDVNDKDFEKELFKDPDDTLFTKTPTTRQTMTNSTRTQKTTTPYLKTTPKMQKRTTTEVPFLPTIVNERKTTQQQTEQNESAQETTITTHITPILNATQVGNFYFKNVTSSTTLASAATATTKPYRTTTTRKATKKPRRPNTPNSDDFDIFGDGSDTITKATTPKANKPNDKDLTIPKPYSTFQSDVFDQPTTKKIISSTTSTFKQSDIEGEMVETTQDLAQNNTFGKPTISSFSTSINTVGGKDKTVPTVRGTTPSFLDEPQTKLSSSTVESREDNRGVPEIQTTPLSKVTTPKVSFIAVSTTEADMSLEGHTIPEDDIFGGPPSTSASSGTKKASSKSLKIPSTPQSEVFDDKVNGPPRKVTIVDNFPTTPIMRVDIETTTRSVPTTKFQNDITKNTQQVELTTATSNLETAQTKKTTGTLYLTFPTKKMFASTKSMMIYSIPLTTPGQSTNEINASSFATENPSKIATTSATYQTSLNELTSFSSSSMTWPTTAGFRPSSGSDKNVPPPSTDQNSVGTSSTKIATQEGFLTVEDEVSTKSATSPRVRISTLSITELLESGKSTTEDLEIIYPVTKATSPKFSMRPIRPITKATTVNLLPSTMTTKMAPLASKPKFPMAKPTLSTTYLPVAVSFTTKSPLDVPPMTQTTKNEFKPKAKTTQKPKKPNNFDYDLFGDSPDVPITKPKGKTTPRAISNSRDVDDIFAIDEVVQRPTKRPIPDYNYIDSDVKPPNPEPKIIYSDFYSPSTTNINNISENSVEGAKLDTATSGVQEVTQQSFITSVSYKVNKKDRSTTTYNTVPTTTYFDVTTETEMPNNEELTINKSELIKLIQKMCNVSRSEADSKALDALALTVLNNAKSITYLKASQDRAVQRSKFKRRSKASRSQRNRRPS